MLFKQLKLKILNEDNKIPNVDIIEVPKGTIESDIDRIFNFIVKSGIEFNPMRKEVIKKDIGHRDTGIRVNRKYVDSTDMGWYNNMKKSGREDLKIVHYKKIPGIFPTPSKYVRQLKFESLNEDIEDFNIGDKVIVKKEDFKEYLEYNPEVKEYVIDDVSGLTGNILDFVNTKEWAAVEFNKRVRTNVNNRWTTIHPKKDIMNTLWIKTKFLKKANTSKYVKQLKFEAVEPGQESPKRSVWKMYQWNIFIRKYGDDFFIYDYEDLKYEDRDRLEKLFGHDGVRLKKELDRLGIKGINTKIYNWNNWENVVKATAIKKIKADFKTFMVESLNESPVRQLDFGEDKWKNYLKWNVGVKRKNDNIIVLDYDINYSIRDKVKHLTDFDFSRWAEKNKKLIDEKITLVKFEDIDWSSWDRDVAEDFVETLKKDFPRIKLNLNNFYGFQDDEDEGDNWDEDEGDNWDEDEGDNE